MSNGSDHEQACGVAHSESHSLALQEHILRLWVHLAITKLGQIQLRVQTARGAGQLICVAERLDEVGHMFHPDNTP
jgi:hypothetical protein